MSDAVRVSILIKALNEEAKIARCLESAVREESAVGGEVILVDSLSTDRTVEIAQSFPVRIVQFENISDRGCGAAVQLGYQFARGEFVYLIDGDMVLQSGFLRQALEYLQANPGVAGVGGLMVDTQILTSADKRRAREYASITEVSETGYLGGGGLYRTRAIQSVGYLAHRWLKACEEAELGVRLKSAGWSLARLPVVAVSHTGHNESSLSMLWRMWRNRRMHAYGALLRSAVGQPWWWSCVRLAWFVFVPPAIYLGAMFSALLLTFVGVPAIKMFLLSVTALWCVVFAALAAKKRNFLDAAMAIFAWHLYMTAAVISFVRKVPDPHRHVPAAELEVGDRSAA
jgi:glycosyltransferase involved in cell wall biosynthesis